jgi:hypothetical protein
MDIPYDSFVRLLAYLLTIVEPIVYPSKISKFNPVTFSQKRFTAIMALAIVVQGAPIPKGQDSTSYVKFSL